MYKIVSIILIILITSCHQRYYNSFSETDAIYDSVNSLHNDVRRLDSIINQIKITDSLILNKVK